MEENQRLSLAAARINAGYNQTQVAIEMDVTRMSIYSWETGKTVPTVLQAMALADLYKQPVTGIKWGK